MNLLFFIHSLSSGGAERVTSNLANHWGAKGWQITIVTMTNCDMDFYKLHSSVKRINLGLDVESSNPLAGMINNFRRVSALKSVLTRVKPDVALSMMSSANVLLALAARGVPGVVAIGSERIHPPQYPLGSIWELLRAKTYRYLSAVIAQTLPSMYWLRKNTNARKIVVIPNAVSWPLAITSPVIKPGQFVRPGKRLLLAVGRLEQQKGFDLLIDVFAELSTTNVDWVLVILGDGDERARLESQIKLKGITDCTFLPGRVGNIGQWYELADVYVLSSYYEGFPNTLVEAMSHGVPPVSFDCETGPGDIIHHDVDGMLVEQGDRLALSNSLARLMSDEALRARYASHAIMVRDKFAIEKIAAIWEDLFKQLRQLKSA